MPFLYSILLQSPYICKPFPVDQFFPSLLFQGLFCSLSKDTKQKAWLCGFRSHFSRLKRISLNLKQYMVFPQDFGKFPDPSSKHSAFSSFSFHSNVSHISWFQRHYSSLSLLCNLNCHWSFPDSNKIWNLAIMLQQFAWIWEVSACTFRTAE